MFKLSGQTKLFLQYARLYNVDRSVQGADDAHLRNKAANTFLPGCNSSDVRVNEVD